MERVRTEASEIYFAGLGCREESAREVVETNGEGSDI